MAQGYKYPLVYFRHPVNVGYDANLRKSLELATGSYCIMMGNDDTLSGAEGVQQLVDFYKKDLPELGFCNYTEDKSPDAVMARAFCRGAGFDGRGAIALKYYRSFSYVAGIIIRKDIFNQVNTDKADGSVFVQMYFAARIITNGAGFLCTMCL